MAYCVDVDAGFTAQDERSSRKALPQNLLGGLALAAIVLACGWTVYANVFASGSDAIANPPTITVLTAHPSAQNVTVVEKRPSAPLEPNLLTAPRFEVSLLDSNYSFGLPPVKFSQNAPLKSATQVARRVAEAVPIPAPRPAEAPARNPSLRAMAQRGKIAPAAENFFEKIFGKPQDPGPALAYAAPDGGVSSEGRSISSGHVQTPDPVTAVYDISARTVYMPDGTKLEAHSGLRDKLDNPRYVHVKMWGPTPPHTYDLVPRESLFHGVQALRMIPVGGEGAIFGRTGLLAHTYMLGPNGDSNGCVSFKNYDAFLRAYQNGKIKRLVVVASMGRAAMAANN